MVAGSTPLLFAMWSAHGRETATVLLELRADLCAKSKLGMDALAYAAATGNLSLTEYILEKGMDPEVQSVFLGAALGLTAVTGQVESLRLLLHRGAQSESRNTFGWTPLITAALFGHADCCRVLVEGRADITAEGRPPGLSGELLFAALALAAFVPRNSPLAVLRSTRGQTAAAIAHSLGHLDVAGVIEEAQRPLPNPLGTWV